MNNDGNDNSGAASNEELLRFLDAGPKVLRWPARGELRAETHGSKGVTKIPGAECPDLESYTELAAGAVAPEQAEKLLSHAADCSACGDVLAWSLSAMEGDPSAEETAAIAELAASRPEWQKKLARELAASPIRQRMIFLRSGWFRAGAAIAAVLLLAAGVVLWQRKSNMPANQLAMAYEQSRIMELRVPGAGFAALSSNGHTRGALSAREPAALLEAQAQISRKLEKTPQDSHWLQLQARADVLEERYDSAIDVLDRLLAQGPVTAELLGDAASAYYQRGLVSGTELDRSTALDYLRRADEQAPDNPVILFNEAIVMEDRGQMMNAAEVWTRYLTLEHDQKWAAEGKRKLTALEQTLNRLKSHQSRIDKMLGSPEAIEALAANPQQLALFDEELSSYDLDKVLALAFPASGGAAGNTQQARGSPCPETCIATRKLLKAIASSLVTQHHDSWLADLLSPEINSLPASAQATYIQALQVLGDAVHEDLYGLARIGAGKALQSLSLFHKFEAAAGSSPAGLRAARAGVERAAVEEMYGLQRIVDFKACRALAEKLRAETPSTDFERYPWTQAQEMVTEKICDDTPETRVAGRKLGVVGLKIAKANQYNLMAARTEIRLADDAEDAGDHERTERLTLETLHSLEPLDVPALRIVGTISEVPLAEDDSPRGYMEESAMREEVAWSEMVGNRANSAVERLRLARTEIRIGAMQEAEKQIDASNKELNVKVLDKETKEIFGQTYAFMAQLMLERGDSKQAKIYLDRATDVVRGYDNWATRTYVDSLSQLDLAQGRLDEAAKALEEEIRTNEGKNVHGGDLTTVAEYAQQDHDLYAELAAVWLAQGRKPESILALWERFRMRSRGLPITQCHGGALDCDLPALKASQATLGSNIAIGQVLLLDRVLLYKVSKDEVVWSQKQLRRQDVLDAAQTLERAVSSPFTSLKTAEQLGARLTDVLLPQIPAHLSEDSALLLESDPKLQNMSWPVLPTAAGPLGLQYPLAEMRSLLAGPLELLGRPTQAETMRRRPVIVGASLAAGNEPPLPEALKEATSVSRLLHASEPLLGEQATTFNLAQVLGSATIFHFAGHAVQTSNGTELLLAASVPNEANPWVDGVYLRQHPPHACQLAVLSACSTGAREASWNHPLQDIVETLGDLGVPEVIATRWQIDSQASVPFMETFYQKLAQGKGVALALTAARRVQSGQSLYENPYYWGAYYVTGRESTQLVERKGNANH